MIYKKAYPGNPLTTMEHLRQGRNNLLNACDWTQMPDCQLTNTEKAAWATYRQQLRDLPATYSNDNNIEDIVWPQTPID
ncbi:MAG: hypothetical protein GOVbin1578_22 [Prokaryotic dsDNA virus sp.]|nr:MAG: hypothetical protein GOVbin1578_22 [Prokaryotic dsDNA virus sp.]|tara:strand:+ start:951 stop:1187 length:237 start_codon:yes stop_codon:yes gene_type:complete